MDVGWILGQCLAFGLVALTYVYILKVVADIPFLIMGNVLGLTMRWRKIPFGTAEARGLQFQDVEQRLLPFVVAGALAAFFVLELWTHPWTQVWRSPPLLAAVSFYTAFAFLAASNRLIQLRQVAAHARGSTWWVVALVGTGTFFPDFVHPLVFAGGVATAGLYLVAASFAYASTLMTDLRRSHDTLERHSKLHVQATRLSRVTPLLEGEPSLSGLRASIKRMETILAKAEERIQAESVEADAWLAYAEAEGKQADALLAQAWKEGNLRKHVEMRLAEASDRAKSLGYAETEARDQPNPLLDVQRLRAELGALDALDVGKLSAAAAALAYLDEVDSAMAFHEELLRSMSPAQARLDEHRLILSVTEALGIPTADARSRIEQAAERLYDLRVAPVGGGESLMRRLHAFQKEDAEAERAVMALRVQIAEGWHQHMTESVLVVVPATCDQRTSRNGVVARRPGAKGEITFELSGTLLNLPDKKHYRLPPAEGDHAPVEFHVAGEAGGRGNLTLHFSGDALGSFSFPVRIRRSLFDVCKETAWLTALAPAIAALAWWRGIPPADAVVYGGAGAVSLWVLFAVSVFALANRRSQQKERPAEMSTAT